MFLQLLALKKNQIKKNYHFIVCLGIRHQKGVEVGLKKSKLVFGEKKWSLKNPWCASENPIRDCQAALVRQKEYEMGPINTMLLSAWQ